MKIKFSDGSICELLDTEGELLTVKDIKRRMAEAIIAIKDAEPLIENPSEKSEDEIFESKGKEFRNYLSELISQNMHGAKTKPEHELISIAEYLDSQNARELWSKLYPKEVMKSYSNGEDVESAFENHFVKPLIESIELYLINDKTASLPKNLKKFISYLNNIKERNFPSSLSGDVALKNAIYESFKMIENYIYKYLHSEYSNRSGIEYIPEDVSSNLSEWELSKLRRDYNTHSELIKKIDESDSLEEKTNYIKELKSKLSKNGSDE